MYRSADEVDRFLDTAVQRKNDLLTDFTRYHDKLYRARSKARGPKAAKALDGSDGGPKGMTGAPNAQPTTAWMQEHDSPITVKGRASNVESYTSNSYGDVNMRIRQGGSHPIAEGVARELGVAKKDFIVTRGARMERHMPGGSMEGLQGTVLRERTPLSTRGNAYPAYSGDTAIRIRVNAGSKGSWVDPVSRYQGEEEYLLPPDTYQYVHSVVKVDRDNPAHRDFREYRWIMDVELVSPQWVAKQGLRTWDTARGAWSAPG